MAEATDTELGTIKMAGDLTGFGESPQLRATGVKPGTYTIPLIVVDSKGRLVFAREFSSVEISELTASETDLGVSKPDSSLTISDGVISVNIAELADLIPIASETDLGVSKPDSSLTISDGVISVPTATASVSGVSKPDGVTVAITDGTLTVATATESINGLCSHDEVTIAATDGVFSLGSDLMGSGANHFLKRVSRTPGDGSSWSTFEVINDESGEDIFINLDSSDDSDVWEIPRKLVVSAASYPANVIFITHGGDGHLAVNRSGYPNTNYPSIAPFTGIKFSIPSRTLFEFIAFQDQQNTAQAWFLMHNVVNGA